MIEGRSRFIMPLALFAAIVAVSTASIFIRFAQADAPSLMIAALRLTIATLMLAPVAWSWHREELRSLTRQELILGVASGLFLAAHFGTWISSLEYTTVASSVVFVSTGPLWVALFSPMLLNERLRRAAIVGLGIAILGGIIIGLSDTCVWDSGLRCPQMDQILQGRAIPSRTDMLASRTAWGNFLALIGAWTVSGYLIIGRKLRAKLSLIPYIFLVYGIAAIALTITMFAVGQTPFGYPARSYGWIFLLAIFPQLIGHSTYNWVLRFIPATFVALITLVEPVSSAILAYLILNEVPSHGVLLGGVLILAGIYLVSRPQKTEAS